jgi:1-acyl-sn-glycerol-3-phosphate acyltransferase
VLYRTLELTVGPALRALHRPQIVGLEHVPRTGPVIIAANHLSFADQVFTPLAAGRQVFYFAKAEYFNSPGLTGKAMAAVVNGLGQVPVDRGDTRSAAASIAVGVQILARGAALGIYPEGTRSPDGRRYKFRTGVARLALRSGAPVVPVGLVGTRDVQPPQSRRWRFATVSVRFGPALQFADQADSERSDRILRSITEQVREAVQELSGQDYADTYASDMKLAE